MFINTILSMRQIIFHLNPLFYKDALLRILEFSSDSPHLINCACMQTLICTFQSLRFIIDDRMV